uniref:Uncharacterized protein n=1 Tax=Magallana gigas TaxID=29159 RepID=A0A8W8LFB1_MAGGI
MVNIVKEAGYGIHLTLMEFCWILQKLSASTQHPLRESEAHHGHMGRVQVPSLNAGINSGGLIWIGPYRRETETSGNIVCSPMELSPLCSVDKWRMQSRAISPLAGGSDGSQGCQMLSLFNRENNAETVFDSGQEIYITVGVRKPVSAVTPSKSAPADSHQDWHRLTRKRDMCSAGGIFVVPGINLDAMTVTVELVSPPFSLVPHDYPLQLMVIMALSGLFTQGLPRKTPPNS